MCIRDRLALLFFITSLSLGYLAGHTTRQDPIQNLANLALQSSSKVNKTNNAEKNLSLNKNTGKTNIDHQQSYPLPSEFP